MTIHKLAIPHIERAIGLKLYDHQVDFLLNNTSLKPGRGTGKTMAYCIMLALSEGEPLNLRKPEEFDDRWTLPNHLQYARSHFRNEFMRVRSMLRTYGFRVRDIKN